MSRWTCDTLPGVALKPFGERMPHLGLLCLPGPTLTLLFFFFLVQRRDTREPTSRERHATALIYTLRRPNCVA